MCEYWQYGCAVLKNRVKISARFNIDITNPLLEIKACRFFQIVQLNANRFLNIYRYILVQIILLEIYLLFFRCPKV